MNSNPDPMLKYSVTNFVANGCLNIEDDEHPLYWFKGEISLSVDVFNNKVHNWLILYLEGQKRNSSNRIRKLKEPWTALHLKEVQSIFQPYQLHSFCHLPKEMAEYLSKKLNNVEYKYQKHGEDDFYTHYYKPGEVTFGWIKS